MNIAIINGPNLNLLGTREPAIYGSQTFEQYLEELKALFPAVQFHYFQSNVEGELINEIQRIGFTYDGIILNAGGYTHTSVAIADAVASIKTPVIEVHISNIFAIQTEISKNISQELRTILSGDEEKLLQHIPTKSNQAYDYYLKGLSYYKEYNL